MGTHNILTLYDPPSQKFKVKKTIVHPNYNSNNFLNDIALIILDRDVQLDDFIQLACLPNRSNTIYPSKVNIDVWAAGNFKYVGKKILQCFFLYLSYIKKGWGLTSYGAPNGPLSLRNVKLTLYAPTACNSVFPNEEKNVDAQICAGHAIKTNLLLNIKILLMIFYV